MISGGTTTMTTITDILKNFYLGPIRDQLDNKVVLYAQVKKSSKEVVGTQVVLPVHTNRNWGVLAGGTGGNATLPGARRQGWDSAQFATKDIYGRIEIRGKTIRATKTDKGAFVRVVKSEMEGMINDLSNYINIMMYLDTTGVLTQINGVATSATQTVDSTQYLEEQMLLDIGSNQDAVISTINSDTEITLSASITTADNDNIRIANVSSGNELNGLDLITRNSGSLQGIDGDAVTIWRGNSRGTAGSPAVLTERQLQQVQDDCEKRGGKIDLIATSFEGRQEFITLLTSQKRFTSPYAGELKGGFKALDFNGIPLVADKHCQATPTETRFYFLSLASLGIYRMADFDWIKEDGNIMARQVGSSATEAYEATLLCDMEFGTNARRNNGRRLGVSVS